MSNLADFKQQRNTYAILACIPVLVMVGVIALTEFSGPFMSLDAFLAVYGVSMVAFCVLYFKYTMADMKYFIRVQVREYYRDYTGRISKP